MWRTALSPRWLGGLLIALLLAGASVQLGRWQWQVGHDVSRVQAVEEGAQRPIVELSSLTGPHRPFPRDGSGQRVTASGSYAAADQLLVPGRLLEGSSGYWVLDRFVSEQGSFPVVRGWVRTPGDASAPPAGKVSLLASLAPSEAPSESTLPAGQVGAVNIATLLNNWPTTMYNAFGFALEEKVGGQIAAPASGLRRVPPPLPDTSIQWRNVCYALQWWLFGLFALFMWAKMVRAAARDEAAAAGTSIDPAESDLAATDSASLDTPPIDSTTARPSSQPQEST